jgi:hypothetical protein
MERQQTSKINAAQNEAFQAAFGREDKRGRYLGAPITIQCFMTKTLTERDGR